MAAEQTPERIDLGPDAYGLNYPTEPGQYLGEVYSKVADNGPTCFYNEGKKTYRVKSGNVNGEFVEGKYLVYLLDLSDTSFSAEQLQDPQTLKQTIESRKDQIEVKELRNGEEIHIKERVLHQAFGKGILRIEVSEGYEEGKMIETDNLSNYVSPSCLP